MILSHPALPLAYVTPKQYGAIGDGATDDTVAFKAAYAAATTLGVPLLLANIYKLTDTIRLVSNTAILGTVGGDATPGAQLKFALPDNRPAFDTDINNYLSFFRMEDIEILDSGNTPGVTGSRVGFKLYGVTNNTHFARISVRNFPSDGFLIARQTLTPADPTACGNVTFDQIFVVSCGGYAFNVDGYCHATWSMCDFNSCVGGAFYFKNGVSNQAMITIIGLWWEGTRSWASLQPVLLEAMGSQVVTFIGASFEGPANGTDIIKMTGASSCEISLVSCCGYTYTNWINDTVAGTTVAFSSKINYQRGVSTNALTVIGASAIMELFDLSGTANQRRWRFKQSGNLLILAEHNDAGSSLRNIMIVNGASGLVEIVNDLKLDSKIGFYGTTPAAQPTITGSRGANAALADLLTKLATLGLIVDSSS